MHSPLLLQILVILIAARLGGMAMRRVGQPAVVGEIAAGIVLGPSLLGSIAPTASAQLFAPKHLDALGGLSQIGLLLFLFLIGLDFDPRHVAGRRVLSIGAASLAIPFALGAALAAWLHARHAPPGVSMLPFAAFQGVAMSITAFPVLARILDERGMMRTPLGVLAIAIAAANDVAAWVALAALTFWMRAAPANSALPLVAGVVFYIIVMLGFVRPLLHRLAQWKPDLATSLEGLALALCVLLASAWATESLGIHALFGAFVAGAVVPRGAWGRSIEEEAAPLCQVLLLPLFFALSGLRVQLGLLSGGAAWLDFALILAVAAAGKWGGAFVAARAVGIAKREASALGALLNARGLVEIVVLNAGLEAGLLSPALFSMMVLMALATTLMATPALAWLRPDAQLARDSSRR